MNLSAKKSALLNSAGIKLISYSVIGDMAASLMGGLATILISRRLGPAGFGQFSAGFALTQILVRVNDLGLSMATSKFIGQAKDRLQQTSFYSLITQYRLMLSVVIVALGLLATGLLVSGENKPILMAAVVVTLATVYFEHLRFSLQALQWIKQSSAANVFQGLIKMLVASAAFFSQGINVLVVFMAYMTAPLVPVIFRRYFSPAWLKNSLVQINSQQKTAIHGFLKHSAVAVVSAGIVENFDVLLAAYYLTDYQTGLLGGVTKIALFLYIISYAIGNVLNPRVAGYNHSQLRGYFRKALGVLVVTLGGLVIAWPLAPYLISWTIGTEYLSAVGVLRILLASGFLSIGLMPFQAIFYALDQNKYFSLTGLMQVLIIVGGGMLFTPLYGILGLAWLRLISRGMLMVVAIVGSSFYLSHRSTK